MDGYRADWKCETGPKRTRPRGSLTPRSRRGNQKTENPEQFSGLGLCKSRWPETLHDFAQPTKSVLVCAPCCRHRGPEAPKAVARLERPRKLSLFTSTMSSRTKLPVGV